MLLEKESPTPPGAGGEKAQVTGGVGCVDRKAFRVMEDGLRRNPGLLSVSR